MSVKDCWDYIVIGCGGSGAVVAAGLSDAGADVLIVEAGGGDGSPLIQVPAGLLHALERSRYNWKYKTEPDVSRNGRADVWPAGRLVGGGTSLNGMLYARGEDVDYDEWAALGATGWNAERARCSFKRIERCNFDASRRGTEGPVDIVEVDAHPLADMFVAAAVEAGLVRNIDYNSGVALGAGRAQIVTRNGRRLSTARAYLRPRRRRSNLTIMRDTLVEKLSFAGDRCTGIVVGTMNFRVRKLHARKEVVLAAGSLSSPAILMRSGIGLASDLAKHGIASKADSPGVGANLSEHVCVSLGWHVRSSTLNMAKRPLSAIAHATNYIMRGRGALALPLTHAVAFAGGTNRAEIELAFSPLAFREGSPRRLHDRPGINIVVGLMHPDAVGRLSLQSSDPRVQARINLDLLGCTADRTALRKGCELARSVMAQSAIAGEVLDERFPGASLQASQQWESFLAERAMPMYHPSGTCRMGSGAESPVDSKLCVKGVEGLRVADCSVLPAPVAGHTHAVAMMIGDCAVSMILGNTV